MPQSFFGISQKAYTAVAVSADPSTKIFVRTVIMIAKELVNAVTACTWRSSRRLRVVLFQAAKGSFRFIYTSSTSAHVILLALLGKAFFHSIIRRHEFSTLTASAVRHDGVLAFVPQRCTMWLWERKIKISRGTNNCCATIVGRKP